MPADRIAWWASLALILAMLVLPLFLADVPPLLDYPNHLARMFVLKHLPDDPVLAQMYKAKWRILPNVGMDFLVPTLLNLLSLNVAGKIFVMLALILPMLGAVMLHRALFRVQSYWPLSTALVAYNTIFLLGFLNFLVGIGLALVASAIWYRQRQQGLLTKRILLALIFALLIFFCHLMAWVFFGLLLLSIEVGAAWTAYRGGKPYLPQCLRSGLAIFVPFAVPFVLLLTAPIMNETGRQSGVFHALYKNIAHFHPAKKIEAALSTFMNYSLPLDLVVALLTHVMLIKLLLKKHLILSPYPAFAIIVLALLFPFIPFYVRETAFMDYRLPLFVLFLVFAGTEPKDVSPRQFQSISVVIGVVFLVRLIIIGITWTGHNADLADLRRIIAPIEPGRSVLTVQTRGEMRRSFLGQRKGHEWRVTSRFLANGIPTFLHLPALVVIEQRALIPLLFTHPWKQPLQVRPAYRELTMSEGIPPVIDVLSKTDPLVPAKSPYLQNWQEKYDYILVLLPTRDPHGVASLLQWGDVLDSSDTAALYRIRRGS
jgi:hypothetical protein